MKRLIEDIRKIPSTFRSLPLKTRQLLSFGLIIALFVALPLFVWAVVTQRFELRKKAAVEPKTFCVQDSECGCALDITTGQCAVENNSYLTGHCTVPDFCTGIGGNLVPKCQNNGCTLVASPEPTATSLPNSCTGQPDGTPCTGGGCPSPLIGPGGRPIACTRPVFLGVCQNQLCTPTTPGPCQGVPDGSSCYLPDPSCPVCTPGQICPKRPCKIIPGTCQNQTCVEIKPSPTPPSWTIKAQAVCKDGTPANHVTRLYAWSGDPSDLKLRQDLENGDIATSSAHTYTWSPPSNYTFICWGMDDATDIGNLKPVCSTTLGPAACKNNPYCSEGNYSTQRYDSLCSLNHTANPNLQEKFCYEGIASEWLQASPPPYGNYTINFQAPDSWCGGTCPNGDKGNLNCDASGLINATDLSILLSQWCPGNCPVPTGTGYPGGRRSPDLNGDNKVNATDLSILLSNWKPS